MTFTIPKQPKIKLKAKPPDQRKIAVLPLRALRDKTLYNQSIRVLGLLCSYANRAGITWVAGTTLAKELGVSKSAISQQMRQLKQKGYVEVIKRGYMGQRTDTVRIIYDPSISATDALAILGNQDELKSPTMLKEELDRMNTASLKKPIKSKKPIVKSNRVNETINDNKTKDIQDMYVKWFKFEKEINDKDVKAIAMVKDWDRFIADLEVEFKMIASEGLRKPEDILATTQQILTGKGL
jgi:DNA-binding transcriptional ArsR family regulator